jgi:tRNA uridine 5-carboxymethylaminomethyl modification enzyme
MLRYPGVTSAKLIPVISGLEKMDPRILERVDIDGKLVAVLISASPSTHVL